MLKQRAARTMVIVMVALVVGLSLPAVALAQGGQGFVSIFESVTIGADQVVEGDVGSIFSSVTVLGRVNGNVFSVFSSVSVGGSAQVTGSVFSIFSNVSVGGNAVVQGDASSVFSQVSVAPTARVMGSQFSGAGNINIRWPRGFRFVYEPWSWSGGIFSGIFFTLFLAALGAVTVALLPRRVEIVKDTLIHNPGASLGVGFLGLLLVLPLSLLLIITCIGPFIVLAGTTIAVLLGLIGIGLWVGQRVMETASTTNRSPITDVVVGTLIVGLIMTALNIVPFLCCIDWLAWIGLLSWALGAVLLSRFGGVPPVVVGAGAPLPPTLPTPPSPPTSATSPTPPTAEGGTPPATPSQ